MKILEVLDSLASNAIPTIAPTKSFAGKFSTVSSAEDLLISRLKKLGINFKNLSPIKEEILIHGMVNMGAGNTPIFKEGIMFTANQDKGQALGYLLEKTKLPAKDFFYR